LSYYVTAGINSSALVTTKLLLGYNYSFIPNLSNEEIIEKISSNAELKSLIEKYDVSKNNILVSTPHVYKNLRSVKPIDPIKDITPVNVIISLKLKPKRRENPVLTGGLTDEQMASADLKFERCFAIMALIETNKNFKEMAVKYRRWMGNIPVSDHKLWFSIGERGNVIERRGDYPKMTIGDQWYDFTSQIFETWRFQDCVFYKTCFAGCNLTNAQFKNCIFNEVDFTLAIIHQTQFVNCEFVNILPANGIDHHNIALFDCKGHDKLAAVLQTELVNQTQHNNADDSDDD
jgi:hypothetical protein